MFELRPGQTIDITWELQVDRPGPFRIAIELFLLDLRLDRIELDIRGLGVPSKATKL